MAGVQAPGAGPSGRLRTKPSSGAGALAGHAQLLALLLMLGAPLAMAAAPVPGWTTLGLPDGISKSQAEWLSLAAGLDGSLTVAYSDKSTNLTCRQYTGAAAGWTTVGGANIHDGSSQYVSLARPPGGGDPVIAFRGNSGKVTVVRYASAKVPPVWEPVGARRFSAAGASWVDVALGVGNAPWVFYSDDGVGGKATVQRFDAAAGAWKLVTTRGFTPGKASFTRIAVGPDGLPVIAYSDAANGGRATVRKLTANLTAWATLGAAGFTANAVSNLRLRLNPANRPVLGYADLIAGVLPRATASRWNGTAWVKLPSAGVVAATGQPVAVALALDAGGVPVIGFADGAAGMNGRLTVKKLSASGTAWNVYGTPGASPGVVRHVSLVVKADGWPAAAYSDATRSNRTAALAWARPSLSFLALGDWGRKGIAAQLNTAALLGNVAAKRPPAFVLSTGDNFYPNGLISAADPAFDLSFKNVYTTPALAGVPWNLVLGNHDNCDSAAGCAAGAGCANSPLFQLDPAIKARDARFNAYRTKVLSLAGGKVDLFLIDTSPFIAAYRTKSWASCPGGILTQNNAANLAAIDALLAASKAPWKVIVGHHPPRSNGDHGNNPDIIAAFEPVMKARGVQAWFAGHDHDLQHLRHAVDSTFAYDIVISGGGSQLSSDAFGTTDSLFFDLANGVVSAAFQADELVVEFYTVQGGNATTPTYTARIPRARA